MFRIWKPTILVVVFANILTCELLAANNTDANIKPPPSQDPKVLALVDNLKLPDGERYEALVPDTLDLADRCQIAAYGMSWSVSDTEYDHEPYSQIDFDHRTPFAQMGNGIGLVSSPKYAEVLPMLRCASGSVENLKIEENFMRAYLGRTSPDDGLHYMTRLTPFSHKDRPWHNDAYSIPEGGKRIKDEDVADMYLNSRHVMALMAWYERSGDKKWLPIIKKAIRGLADAAIKKDDYAYYPDGGIGMPFSRPRSGWTKTEEAKSEAEGGEGSIFMYHGGQIRAFARYYKLTGDKEALDMAQRLSRYVLKARFWGAPPYKIDGSPTTSANAKEVDWTILPQDWDISAFEALKKESQQNILGRGEGHWMGHAHGHLSVFRGLLELADATDDQQLKEFVRSGYEYSLWWLSVFAGCGDEKVRSPGYVLDPRAKGTARLGCFGETCALADCIALAIRLSDEGVYDYWDDVDRWVRNHLAERQITDTEKLKKVSQTCSNADRELPDARQVTTDDVINRFVGLYPPNTRVNDLIWQAVGEDAVRAFVCCCCNGTQALYYAWESIVRKQDDWVQVNLLLNRASPWLDIDSYIPYEGKVVLHIKTVKKVRIRMPLWTRPGYLNVKVNDAIVPVIHKGNYVEFTGLKPKDMLILEFPMRQTIETVGEYTCTFRGNTLCKIEPQADENHYPIYQREKYLQDNAPMKKVECYVAPKTLTW